MQPILRSALIAILCLTSVLESAAYVNVKGRLASATDDTPLAGATIRLLTLPDSTMLIGTYSDKDGLFSVASSRVSASANAKTPTQVLVVASYMGYQTVEKKVTVRPRVKEYDLKDVYMQEDARILGEALVSATPPPVLIREDTVEYYADSYKTQPDATVEDLLKRLPGVEVGTDGSITAQGETVQQVYVDGKEFFGKNTQVTTKNLTADMVESVQVVDMQTEEARLTGIDDGERRKVINLKLKPKMRRGWFGNMAGAWGLGRDIDDRFETKGMVGYFRGNSQNALVLNGNNTNNTGFGDLGDGVMSGSAMRGNRNSGARGDGLNTSWSIGLNLGYDKGNRMRDADTPFELSGNVMYGGSDQDEESKTHRINYLSSGNTESDSYTAGNNKSQNVQTGIKFEKSWGELKDGRHRIQISPSFNYNETRTDDYSEGHTYYGDSIDAADAHDYISQTQRRNEMDQKGYNMSLSGTYSFAKKTDRGRRRTSITLSVSERANDGDQYTRSYTTYDSSYVTFDRYADLTTIARTDGDTLINQWQQEDSHNESYRIRLTHVEPLADRQTLELSATANLSDRHSAQTYHFWDGAAWSDSIDGRSNADYNSDTWTRNVNYTLSASYRKVTDMYNFSVGMDFLPQSQKYTDYADHTRDYTRHYVNFSPRAEYRYNWSRKKNLRITLNGQTNQPSMNQLQARKNQTSATHVSLGNPDLDPSFTGNFSARYRSFNDETYSTIEANLSAKATANNLSTKRWYSDDLRTDTTQTVNLSGIGSWNAQGNFRGSWPFYDNLWYVTSNTSLGYSESEGYISQNKIIINGSDTITIKETILNTTRNYTCGQQAGIAYRGEKLNVELRGNYNVQYSEASIVTSGNLGTTHRFGVTANATAYLPWDFTLSSDFNYTARRGYSAGLTRNQSIWNAQLSRTFLKKKNLTAFIKVFDILREKSSISRNVSATALTDRETTVLGQYFLIGASMKFNKMGQRGGQRGRSGDGDFNRGFGGGGDRGGRSVGGGGGWRDDNMGGGRDF
ncbi:MAG: outer membrane beta-barrel protein [Bacteroidales bacterium]|nr:outer membrane beta-barrel protein [Bacteroidales bacterium]